MDNSTIPLVQYDVIHCTDNFRDSLQGQPHLTWKRRRAKGNQEGEGERERTQFELRSSTDVDDDKFERIQELCLLRCRFSVIRLPRVVHQDRVTSPLDNLRLQPDAVGVLQ
eukprot:633079-Amorphochlora_amoeboformis.AAC.1